MTKAPEQGNLFIVAAPSGGGKTSLVKNIVETLPDIAVSVSHTTRDARPGEQEGRDYYFVSQNIFLEMVNEDEFIEHATVFDHYYGTSKAEISNRLASGVDVVLDIDWQGAKQIRALYPDAVSVFIIPPSLAELKNRLENRQRDNASVIENRMQQAQNELSHFAEFDYLIVNDDFLKAADDLKAIVTANRLLLSRQTQNFSKLLSLLLMPQ